MTAVTAISVSLFPKKNWKEISWKKGALQLNFQHEKCCILLLWAILECKWKLCEILGSKEGISVGKWRRERESSTSTSREWKFIIISIIFLFIYLFIKFKLLRIQWICLNGIATQYYWYVKWTDHSALPSAFAFLSKFMVANTNDNHNWAYFPDNVKSDH